MDDEQTLKILKMVQEGFLTPEQGQRLILELQKQSTADKRSQEQTGGADPGNVFSFLGQGMEKVFKDFQSGFDFASQTVRQNLGFGPQNLIIRTIDLNTAKERLAFSFPLKLFLAFKVVLSQDNPLLPPPFRQVDFPAVFQALESGETGTVFEITDHDRAERIEVVVQ